MAQPPGPFVTSIPYMSSDVSSVSSGPYTSVSTSPTGHVPNLPALLRWIYQEGGSLPFQVCRPHDAYELAHRKNLIEAVTLTDGNRFVRLTDNGYDYLSKSYTAASPSSS